MGRHFEDLGDGRVGELSFDEVQRIKCLEALRKIERSLEQGDRITYDMTDPVARDLFYSATFQEAHLVHGALAGNDIASAISLQSRKMTDWVMRASQASSDRWQVQLERHAAASKLTIGMNRVKGIGDPAKAYSLAIIRALIAQQEADSHE